jgi:hypothetical protein
MLNTNGATKSKPSAAATSAVAAISTALTRGIGSPREHSTRPAQLRFEER